LKFAIFLDWKIIAWAIRAAVLIFFLVGAVLETHPAFTPFFQNFAEDHMTWSSILIFLAVIGFIQPFIQIKKHDGSGGETMQRKFQATIGILLGVLFVFMYLAMFQHDWLMVNLESFGGGTLTILIDSVYRIGDMIGTPLNGLGVGLISAFTISLVVDRLIWPKIHHAPVPQPQYQGAPTIQQPAAQSQPQAPVQQVVVPEKQKT
jgi:hypothetical protein